MLPVRLLRLTATRGCSKAMPAATLTTLQHTFSLQQRATPSFPATFLLSSPPSRSFFNKAKKTEEISQQQQQAATAQSADASASAQPSKADALGFGPFKDLVYRLHTSWAHVKTYGVWVGVGTGVLLVFKGGLSVVDFFSSLTLFDVGEVAFGAGVLTGAGVVGCAMLGARFLRLRPEAIYQHSLRRLSQDPTVASYMGGAIQPGSFRAYSFRSGAPRITAEEREKAAVTKTGVYKWWKPRRLQLFYQVEGANGVKGMASVEAEKSFLGDYWYNLLSVELESGERIVLEGDVDYRIYKGIIKLR